MGDGLTDFRPSPEESRAIIAAGYTCPATLLVQFETDSFDETPEMEQILTGPRDCLAAGYAAAAATAESTAVTAAVEADAWSSIDEDIDINRVLASLGQLRQQRQQQQQQYMQDSTGQVPSSPLQRLVLPGSHITPCGAQLGQDNAEFKNLARQVLSWMNSRRIGAVPAVAVGR